MTYVSRLSKIGMAIETSAGTYLAPVFPVPFNAASFETIQDPLRDESIRANDSMLQGVYAGPSHSTFDIDMNLYSDVIGYLLRFIGPDTVTAATSTTLSSSASIGATTISTAASIAAGSTIKIDTAGNIEYAVTGTPTGGGPYTIPISNPSGGLTIAHSSGVAVVTTTTHTFKQTTASRPPSYSITVFDGVGTNGWTYMTMTDLGIKVDPKGIVTVSPKFVGAPEAAQSTYSPSYSAVQPWLGWQWTMTNAGGSSTRGLTLDVAVKRAVDVVYSSDGTQVPREVFSGALESDHTYKAIFENTTDLNMFLNYSQAATTATITQQPQYGGVQIGGASLAITTSQTAWHKTTRDLSGTFVALNLSGSGIYNATDGGSVQAVLKNFVSSSY